MTCADSFLAASSPCARSVSSPARQQAAGAAPADSASRTCLLCGAGLENTGLETYDTRFGVPDLYTIVACQSCQVEQLWPRPDPASLAHLYATYYNFGGEKGTCYTRLRDRFFFSRLYRLWLALDGDISFHARCGSGRLLDVGCNEGRCLKFYAASGFRVEGLEVNPVAAAVARCAGFVVHQQELSSLPGGGLYDVIVFSNVLEHALDPRAILLAASRLLKNGGEVWISCPHSRSWLRQLFGGKWINWHVPFHIVHLSVPALSRLLADSGFVLTSLRQRTPALWVSQSLLAGLFARRGRPTRQLRNPAWIAFFLLLVRLVFFPVLWLANLTGHGDCLVAVARKA